VGPSSYQVRVSWCQTIHPESDCLTDCCRQMESFDFLAKLHEDLLQGEAWLSLARNHKC
jgi:hypothetical protein